MAARPITSAQAGNSSIRGLRTAGEFGAILALAILGASMLLRLTTIFGADGQTISTLPPAIESATRMVHRLAASGVGLLAMCAVFLCWSRRPLPGRIVKPLASIVAATIGLAVIGPLTPGYRVAAVTVANVAGGVVLLIAFWWLRESVATDSAGRKPVESLARAAIIVFLLHVATGAAASANEMHGIRWFAFVHLGTAMLLIMFVGASLWECRREPSLAGWSAATTIFMAAQWGLGFALMSHDSRPVWLGLLHGMLSPMLAIALVSLAIRGADTHGSAGLLDAQ